MPLRVTVVSDVLLAPMGGVARSVLNLVHYMDSRPPLDFPLGRLPAVVTQRTLMYYRLSETKPAPVAAAA